MYSGVLYALGDYAALKELLEPVARSRVIGNAFLVYSAVLLGREIKGGKEYYELASHMAQMQNG